MFATDRDASRLLNDAMAGLADHSISPVRFRNIVEALWGLGAVVTRGPASAAYTGRVLASLETLPGADYGRDSEVKFISHQLFGAAGQPGAIHVQAPGERSQSPLLRHRNRAPHSHATARLSVITGGSAVFYAHRCIRGRDTVLAIPVAAHDVIACPAGVPHTFDAGRLGFSLVSAMERYHPPGEPGYAMDVDPRRLDLDALPRVSGLKWMVDSEQPRAGQDCRETA